jgi:hypothetical protein
MAGRFEEVMKRAEKIIKERTCDSCLNHKSCDKQEECIVTTSGFHRFYRGIPKDNQKVRNKVW